MFIPYIKRGFLYWQDGRVWINDCNLDDLKKFLLIPNQCREIEDQDGNLIHIYTFDIDIGEVNILVAPLDYKVMSLQIELFEDCPLESFLQQQGYLSQKKYQFLDDEGESFIIFNRYFYAGLTRDLKKISCFVYSNRDFQELCEDSLTDRILNLSVQLGQFH